MALKKLYNKIPVWAILLIDIILVFGFVDIYMSGISWEWMLGSWAVKIMIMLAAPMAAGYSNYYYD